MREESVKILRENNNLDLKTYKPFIKEFYRYSGDMFEFDDNIFKGVVKDPIEVAEEKLKRSLKNEQRHVSNDPKLAKEGESGPSPERINNIMKKLPPFINDNIPADDITQFQKKGLIGWGFLTTQVLNISEDQIEEMR